MSTRKYMSEAGIHVLVNCVMLLQQTDFEKMEDDEIWKNHLEDFPSHIYSIVRRPRVMVDETSLSISEASVSGKFVVRSAAGTMTYPFQIRNGMGSVDLRLSAPYPHYILFAHDKSGAQVSAAKASLLASLNGVDMGENLAFEVCMLVRPTESKVVAHLCIGSLVTKLCRAFTPKQPLKPLIWKSGSCCGT